MLNYIGLGSSEQQASSIFQNKAAEAVLFSGIVNQGLLWVATIFLAGFSVYFFGGLFSLFFWRAFQLIMSCGCFVGSKDLKMLFMSKIKKCIALRNEIFAQVIKELNNNPNPACELKCWQVQYLVHWFKCQNCHSHSPYLSFFFLQFPFPKLLACCCACFTPNHFMLKYVAAYLRLRTTLKTNADFTEYAKYCEKLLQVK